MEKVLVTGGCGYVGSVLVPELVRSGFFVKVVDLQWFGNHLDKNLIASGKVEIHKIAVSELTASHLQDVDSVIHLANVANDPGVELNPTMSWEVNVLHMTQLLELCKCVGIKNFIYASSGSVYGVKSEPKVTEELSLVPISTYNKTKMAAERVALSYKDHFRVICVRPATVCGLSPRMRFDVVVNMFIHQAFTSRRITVLGGNQIRPNIHIDDLCKVYLHFLQNDSLQSGFYNAGFENISVLSIAEQINANYGSEIEVLPSNDPRSYRQDSTKLLSTGFAPTKSVEVAIREVWNELESGHLKESESWYTVKMMKKLNLDL